MVDFKHDLGVEARDKVTKLKGVITGRMQCLNGCNRYMIEPEAQEDGKLPEPHMFDEARLEILAPAHKQMADEAAAAPAPLRGGPPTRVPRGR